MKKKIDPNDIVIAVLSTLGIIALTGIVGSMLAVIYSGTFLAAWINPEVYASLKQSIVSAHWFNPVTKSAMSVWMTFSLVFFSMIAGNVMLILLYWRKFNILFPNIQVKLNSLKKAVTSEDAMYYTNNPNEEKIIKKTVVSTPIVEKIEPVKPTPVVKQTIAPKPKVEPIENPSYVTPPSNYIPPKPLDDTSEDEDL